MLLQISISHAARNLNHGEISASEFVLGVFSRQFRHILSGVLRRNSHTCTRHRAGAARLMGLTFGEVLCALGGATEHGLGNAAVMGVPGILINCRFIR
ncbi:hypothetical protein GWI33_002434 [Rhynchophorus ferrugineus]|uniref:Uncharacterized protein n=1 Tax=Rhynchophorus ferrugineus TaxID=354439 RepID=A0A834J324_RHYFE|nr:hypothetical protein GWI33_002434 [Rhynchophorus ferrugineus]